MGNIALWWARWEYREDMALSILTAQLTPWLVALPLMLLILVVMLSRELRPLKKLAQTLRWRPESEEPLDSKGVPAKCARWLNR
jgi:two-component system sensor histidine kinase QseC